MSTRRKQSRPPPESPAMPTPTCAVSRPSSSVWPLSHQSRKKFSRIHTVRRVMRTRIYTARLLQMRAQIARRGLLLHHRLLAPRVFQIFHTHLERVQVNISVRAIPRAQSASNAPIFDDYFQRISPPDRSDRTSDHAQRIAALPAGRGHQKVFESQSLAHRPRRPVMRIRASVYTRVAPGAILQVQHQQALRLHQPLRQKLIERHALQHLHALGICGLPFAATASSPRFALPGNAPPFRGSRRRKFFTSST